MKKLLLLLFFIVTWTESQVKSIVFDLNGVLFSNNKAFIIKKLGILPLAVYMFRYFNNPTQIQVRFFDLLTEAFPFPIDMISIKTQDEKGNTLPYIMDRWLDGTIDSLSIIPQFKEYLLKNNQLKQIEKKIFYRLAHVVFNPSLFAQSQILSNDGVETIKTLKKLGYKLYVLSNWPSDSFQVIKEQNQDLFDQFDGILISGDCHINKPNPAIYHELLKQFLLVAEETMFIDDQPINVMAAQKCGIHAVVCPLKGFMQKPDFSLILKMIQTLNT